MHKAARIWRLLPYDQEATECLQRKLQISPIVAQLLLNRGLAQPKAIRRFLDAPLTGLYPPQTLPGVVEATDRLHAAVSAKQRICIYGDYDVDGLTGTAILWQTLRLLGASVDYYVPNRLNEGYGLNAQALRQIARSGTSVVVTVDCGIGGFDEALEARRLGLDLIVTDHHPPKERLPDVHVVVHPSIPGSSYPFGGLSGSAVAFKLAWSVCQRACGGERVSQRFRDHLVDGVVLAALGMIADVVPLQEENRIFVRHGLARLRQCSSLGLQALLEVAGLGGKKNLTAADVSYALAPRINAAGRLGCARLVVDLLTCRSRQRALELARYLDSENQRRQQIERRILAEACHQVDSYDLDSTPALVLASQEWHPGVIGIVAGRLVDLYARPVLMIALHEKTAVGHGSGRSVPGFPLHQALEACGEGLISHGGHAAAAGFKIPDDRINPFRERFCAYAARHLPPTPAAPFLVIDAELPLPLLTPGLVDSLAQLEPYGAGNPRPVFVAGPVQVVDEPRRVGRNERHLQFHVRQQQTTVRAIGFNLADHGQEMMSAGGQCFVAFTPSFNEWQGWRSMQLEIRDFQAGTRARFG